MARRWSKLQKQIYNLIDDKVPIQIHCIDMGSALDRGSLRLLGLYKVRLGKEVIWDFPKDFLTYNFIYPDGGNCFSYSVTDINILVREYIDTPKEMVLEKKFANDWFNLTDILKAADRRFGQEKLISHFSNCENKHIIDILNLRFGK
ncbi:MAG: hypothetical protein GY874_11700 [Desulfobacteraceae bacterium]|nr:hypothetical protein [Desulfobacteraceae bacterium]